MHTGFPCPHCGKVVWVYDKKRAIADSPPDGRTIVDPPPTLKMNPSRYGKPKTTPGLCGWDDMGTAIDE